MKVNPDAVEWIAYRRHGEISRNLHARPISPFPVAAFCGAGRSGQAVVIRPGAIDRPRCERCEMALRRIKLAQQETQ